DRIRDIGKGGSTPPPSRPSSPSGGGKTAGGIGGIIVMAAVLGGMRACNNSTKSYNYPYTPPPPQIQFQPPPPQFNFNPPPNPEVDEQIRRLLRDRERFQAPPDLIVPQ